MSFEHFTADAGRDGLYGVYVGVVTDNEDPDDLARVKVRFPWRAADDDSRWARIATPMAGDGRGTYFLPEVGDEVLVAFEGGDIHNPYVVGALWNGQDAPPATNDGSNDVRKVSSREGHEVVFDDGGGGITIHTAGGHEVVLDDESDAVEVTDANGNSIEMDDSGVSVSTWDDISLSGQNISLKATNGLTLSGGRVSVSAKKQATIASKAKMGIDAKGKLAVGAKGKMDIKSPSMVTIKGGLIQLN